MNPTDKHSILTYELAHKLFIYDHEEGVLRWRVSSHKHNAGTQAGRFHNRYWYVKYRGREYLHHRVIWLYMTGDWPKEQIDHIDMDPWNNRWTNLREATPSQNGCNVRVKRNNTTGYRGVTPYYYGEGFVAQISYKNKAKHIGIFKTKEEAARAYSEYASKLHGEFARTNP